MTKKIEDLTIKEIIDICGIHLKNNPCPSGCIRCKLNGACGIFDGFPVYFYGDYGKYLKKKVTLSDTDESAET